MENNQSTDLQQIAEDVAENTYDPADYQSRSFTDQGLAITHEQVSDDYMEGTNDGKIDQNGEEKNIEIPRTGYDSMFPDADT